MKLPFEKLRGKAPWKGKMLFSGKKKQKEDTAADMAPAGAHSKKKKRRKLKKKVVIPVAAVVLLAGGWGVHHILTAGGADGTQAYTESEAVRQDIQLTLSATGTIEPANQYGVTASVQGEVLSCTFEEGDEVKRAMSCMRSTARTHKARSSRRSFPCSRARTATARRWEAWTT